MSGHAILAPSAAHRNLACLGSAGAGIGVEDESSEYADEGTAAHTMGSWCLSNGRMASQYPDSLIHVLNDDGSIRRTFNADDDMRSYVQVYVDSVNDRMHASATLLVEQRVNSGLTSLLFGDVEGTGDAIIIAPEFEMVEIHDLKYGRGVRVDALENWQLREYGLGALRTARALFGDVFKKVRHVIHMPRLDHMDVEELPVEELLAWGAWAQSRIDLIDAGDVTRTPGEKQCRWCPAKATCGALAGFVANAISVEFPDVGDLTGFGLGAAMEKAELAEMWASAIKKAAFIAADSGEKVPGWHIGVGRQGNRKWTKPEEVENILKNTYRLTREEMYNSKLISPTDAEKRLKTNPKRWEDLQHYIIREPGSKALVRDDDGKPAPKSIADHFQ
jgi:hypothetical protein